MLSCCLARRRAVRACAAGALALSVLSVLLTSSAATAAAPGTFATVAPSPSYINAVVTDTQTNVIYAQQNSDNGVTPGTQFYSYNPKTNLWKQLASSPESMFNNAGAAYLNGKIYVGYSDDTNHEADTSLAVYDIAANTWTTIANPLGEASGDITAYRGLLYMVNGTRFVSYKPSTGTTRTLADPPDFTDSTGKYGDCHQGFQPWGSLAPYGGKIYGTEGNSCNAFAVYDVASNTWTELPTVPSGAVLGGAIDPVTGTFYTYGNYNGDTWDVYKIATHTWTTMTYPYSNVGDGGLAYVSTPGLQGIYSTTGENDTGFGFNRYNTVAGPAVSVKNSAGKHHPSVGTKFKYTVRVKNSGGTSAKKVTLVDKLPSVVRIDSVRTTKGKCSAKRPVKCKLGTLKPGHSVKVRITVTAHKKGKGKSKATVKTTSFNASQKTTSTVTIKVS